MAEAREEYDQFATLINQYYTEGFHFYKKKKYCLALEYFKKVFEPIDNVDDLPVDENKLKEIKVKTLRQRIKLYSFLREFNLAKNDLEELINLKPELSKHSDKLFERLDGDKYLCKVTEDIEITGQDVLKKKDVEKKINKITGQKLKKMQKENELREKIIIRVLDKKIDIILNRYCISQTCFRVYCTCTSFIMEKSLLCLEYIAKELETKALSISNAAYYTKKTYQIIGLTLLGGRKLAKFWSEKLTLIVFRAIHGFCKLSPMTVIERSGVRRMVTTTFRFKIKFLIKRVKETSEDYEICFMCNQVIRKRFFKCFSPIHLGELRGLIYYANLGLQAAQRTQYAPWLFLALLDVICCSIKLVVLAKRKEEEYHFEFEKVDDIPKEVERIFIHLDECEQVVALIEDNEIKEYLSLVKSVVTSEFRSPAYGIPSDVQYALHKKYFFPARPPNV